MNWNEQQTRAIAHRGGSLLLSAGAGSGKTAVLTERIAQLCLEGAPLSAMLVVTYTNAAAAEMKRRIQLRLTEAACDPKEAPERQKSAQKQLEQFGAASISTLHAFCTQVLRRHFQAAGVDPAFRIADDFEAGALRRRAADEAILAAYEQNSPGFLALSEAFGGRGGRNLPQLVLRCYDFLMTQPDWRGWLDTLPHRFSLAPEEIAQSPAARALCRQWASRCQKSAALLSAALRLVPIARVLEDAGSQLAVEGALLRALGAAFSRAAKGEEAPPVAELWESPFGTLAFPRGKRLDEAPGFDKERIQSLRNAAKKPFDSAARQAAVNLLDGRIQAGLLARSRPQAEALCALLKEFEARYAALKAEKSLLDFSDLEHKALEALRVPEVAQEYHEKFAYVFVDEYQDSSGLQESILGTFCRDTTDLFCVGDVKQSIYSFRAALPGLFLARAERAARGVGTVLPLNRNYRTAPSLLACVNDLFSRAMQGEVRYGADDALLAGRSEDAAHPTPPLAVRILERDASPSFGEEDDETGDGRNEQNEVLSDAEWEALLCARLIRQRLKEPVFENGAARPARFGDVAVLLRTTSGLSEVFCRVFAQEGIPAYADLTGGYFDAIEVQVLLNLLRLCDNRRQDVPLLSVLRSGVGGFTAGDVANVRLRGDELFRAQQEQAAEPLFVPEGSVLSETPDPSDGASPSLPLRAPNGSLSYFDALCLTAEQDGGPLGEKCRAFLSLLSQARQECRLLRLSRFVEWLVRRTGYDDQVAALPGGAQRTANLEQFLNRVRAYESASPRGLPGFLTYIDEALATGKDMGEARTVGGSDCVRILSIHRSKGLEFPLVYLCGAGRGFNQTDSRRALLLDQDLGLCMKSYDPNRRAWCDTLFRQAAAQSAQSAQLEEELRVLYVALTRSREELTVIGTVKNARRAAQKWADFSGQTPACPLDWIMAATASFSEAQPFYEACRLARKGRPQEHDGRWAFFLHERSELSRAGSASLSKEDFFRWKAKAQRRNASKFSAGLNHFAIPAVVPAKTAVSALSREDFALWKAQALETDPAAFSDGLFDPASPAVPKKNTVSRLSRSEESVIALRRGPRFLGEERFTAASRGSATHLVLERLDLTRPLDEAGVRTQIGELVERQLLTPEEAALPSVRSLARFFASDLGRRMAENPALRREQPFTLPLSARELGYDSDEVILVQGVIDACFPEADGWVLLDYKTDRLNGRTPYETAAQHSAQLALYARALEAATGRPVVEKFVFLLSCGEAVAL